MHLTIVNGKNEKIGDFELKDELFGGRIKTDLIWEAVVQENAAERRGISASSVSPWESSCSSSQASLSAPQASCSRSQMSSFVRIPRP